MAHTGVRCTPVSHTSNARPARRPGRHGKGPSSTAGSRAAARRLLIDERHQRRGYGSAALTRVVEVVRAAGGKELLSSFQAGEGEPWPFYERFGFVKTGDFDDSEAVIRLDLRA